MARPSPQRGSPQQGQGHGHRRHTCAGAHAIPTGHSSKCTILSKGAHLSQRTSVINQIAQKCTAAPGDRLRVAGGPAFPRACSRLTWECGWQCHLPPLAHLGMAPQAWLLLKLRAAAAHQEATRGPSRQPGATAGSSSSLPKGQSSRGLLAVHGLLSPGTRQPLLLTALPFFLPLTKLAWK